MKDNYKNDFDIFLSLTDEKEVLIKEISQNITEFDIKSILDIGAGNGLISIPLSKKVEFYTAIEQQDSYAQKLREAGLNIIKDDFPTKLKNKYDLVLISHSLTYKRDSMEPFIDAAWDLVEPGGRLLIITYRRQHDDWDSLMEAVGEQTLNKLGYDRLFEYLTSLGEVKVKKVITTVKSNNLNDMINSLSFVASDGDPERKIDFIKQSSIITEILESKYMDGNNYVFPFQHYLLYVYKKE